MRITRPLLITSGLLLGLCAMAAAAVLPAAHTQYFYRKAGTFSISLGTSSPRHVVASKPMPIGALVSAIIVVCSSTPSVTELQMGFPGAKLTLKNHRYGFSVSYREKRADLVTFTTGAPSIKHEKAHATISGHAVKGGGIAGTISVSAHGCSLKSSSYRATKLKAA